jgi:DNA-binding transcriptional MerR regulator/effector-binding domain-containing protein
MFRIGDFSRLGMVTVHALRHYDALGLLKPAHTDANGYRYYSAAQLPRLHRLLAFREMGLSLDEIARLMDAELPSATVRALLNERRAALQRQISGQQAQLERLEAWLGQFEYEGGTKMAETQITIKSVAPFKVASIRQVAPTIEAMTGYLGEIHDYLTQNGVQRSAPDLIAFYHTGFRTENLDIEAAVPVSAELLENGRIMLREMPPVAQMLSYIHRGSYANLRVSYVAIADWMEAQGYRFISGLGGREIYLRHDPSGNEAHEVEIQFPVEKV